MLGRVSHRYEEMLTCMQNLEIPSESTASKDFP